MSTAVAQGPAASATGEAMRPGIEDHADEAVPTSALTSLTFFFVGDVLQAFALEWTAHLVRQAVRVQVGVQIAHTPPSEWSTAQKKETALVEKVPLRW